MSKYQPIDPSLSNREIIIITLRKLRDERYYYNCETELWSKLSEEKCTEIRNIILKNNYATPRPHAIVELQITPRGETIEENEIDRYGNDSVKEKSKRDIWKIIAICVAVISAYPSYYTIYNTNKESELEDELMELQELHKSCEDNIDPILIFDNNLDSTKTSLH